MGPSGSGKSSVASALAVQLGLAFIEGDDFHSPLARDRMAAGIALTDDDRWPWLDALAGQVNGSGTAVMSCSALKRTYRDHLRATVRVPPMFIFLSVPRAVLVSRMTARPGHFMPLTLLDSQLVTLEPPGFDEKDVLTIDATEAVASIIDRIIRR